MVEPKAGIKRLARETRQRIYDYVFSDTGDQTIKVTLDQHDKLHFENGNTIFDLVLTARFFAEEVLPYLFQYVTFALTDSLRMQPYRPRFLPYIRARWEGSRREDC